MKITDVKLPNNEESLGLKPINMYRLEELVVIAGQNGAGKSRLLDCVQKKISSKPSINKRKEILKDIKYNYNYIDMVSHQSSYDAKTDDPIIEEYHKKIEKNNQLLESTFLTTDVEAEDRYVFLNFKPQSITLLDPYTIAIKDRDSNAFKMDELDNITWDKGVLSKIQYVQDLWWDANHQFSEFDDFEKKKIEQEYERLITYIKSFLGADLKRKKGQATLFDFPLGEANLSDGQNILLQLCIALYSLEAKMENIILFIDEPENSLHPNILLDTIDKISEVLKNGQIWIATHSINLLAHVDPSYIWYMNDGAISYAGKIPETVLKGLLGNDERIGELSDFLSLPAQLATIQYAYECLQSPETVLTDKNDRQVNQIYNYLAQYRPLSLLDFGAGKGRLITTLFELDKEKNTITRDTLEYFAYNIDADDREACEININSIYQNDKKRHFYCETDLRNEMPKHTCNIVLMTNVFHEIQPDQWDDAMKLVDHCLMDGGYLMIIEDQVIPKGEKAYKEGFIVFDKAEFKELFKLDDYVCETHSENKRLKLHVIPKIALSKMNPDTKKKALFSHVKKAEREINSLRSQKASYENGKLHAFWTQQFTNASLALK